MKKRIRYLTYDDILRIVKGLKRLYPEDIIEVMNRSGIHLALEATRREAENIKCFKIRVVKKASRLFYELIMLHPFVDGNKRVAAAALILFLRNNSYKIRRKSLLEKLALKIAEGKVRPKQVFQKLHKEVVKE